MIALPVGENRMIVASFVSTKHRNVTEDRRTDGRTDGQTDGRIRSWHIQRWNSFQLFRRAVKTWMLKLPRQCKSEQQLRLSLWCLDWTVAACCSVALQSLPSWVTECSECGGPCRDAVWEPLGCQTATPAVTLASCQEAHQLQARTSRLQCPDHLGS